MILFTSCGRISDEYYKDKAIENYTSPYKGKWLGNYIGDEEGILTIDVSKNGYITITRNFSNDKEIFYAGIVRNDSALQSVVSQYSGFTLYGNLELKSGTWKKGTRSGSWSVTKQ